VGGLILAARVVPARIDSRLLVVGGMALVVYANWRMLGYSPAMDWRAVVVAGVLQGAGLGILLPTLTKTAFSTLDPAFRPEGTAFFNLSRLYGSSIGVALVLFFYDNTQAMHIALAKDLMPYRAAAHVGGSVAGPELATLNDMVTGRRDYRPIQGHDDRNADREPACTVSQQAAPSEPTRMMSMASTDTLRYARIALNDGSGAVPAVEFGTLIPDPLAAMQATKIASNVGFRHLDNP
jgi:hypothetical protein